MNNQYVQFPFLSEVSKQDITTLNLEKAIDFATTIFKSESSTLVECARIEKSSYHLFSIGDEVIIFDTQVEIGQKPINNILYKERIAVHFTKDDINTPWVYALRETFPQVPHTNSMHFDLPKCLCIYEKLYDELKLDWRSIKFLQDIRTWLALTGAGKLHQQDQPLEPFFIFNEGTIVLPPDLNDEETLYISLLSNKKNKFHFSATKVKLDNSQDVYQSITIKGVPQAHGVLNKTPDNIVSLHQVLQNAGINIYSKLQLKFQPHTTDFNFLQSRLILILQLPKTETTEGRIENDFYTFLSFDNIETIGIKLNFWNKGPQGLGFVFPAESPIEEVASSIKLGLLIPYIQYNREFAINLSNNDKLNLKLKNNRIVQIGTGALGSQIFMNIARTGIGKWTLIDEDILLPHNLSKHELKQQYVSYSKSHALSHEANNLLSDASFSTALWENYLMPDDDNLLNNVLTNADIILDISTSIPVARELADKKTLKAKRVSMFLNPGGNDLIVLAEDNNRHTTLDILEFQYYKNIINNNQLSAHLLQKQGIRYSNACRDITNKIPQEFVSLHSSIATNILKQLMLSTEAELDIWQILEDMSVRHIEIKATPFQVTTIDNWMIIVDDSFLEKIDIARSKKLPNETGGIIIGGYDLNRKKIYFVDTILSPDDSEEYPYAYIRGIKGVEEKLKKIDNETAEHLMYVGEWHSHPKDCSLKMSEDDKILLSEIDKEMKSIGFPALILIVGDNKKYEIYLH